MKKPQNRIKTIFDLFSKADPKTRVINYITLYRIVCAPFLLLLLFTGHMVLFKWLLLFSFLTDLVDGYLARKYKVVTALGSKLDSIGDDLTVLVAIIALFKIHFDFITDQIFIIAALLGLYLTQLISSLIRYRKMSGFHTYTAKVAAFTQGVFLVSALFFKEPNAFLFYLTALFTAIGLIEEIILVFILREWKNDVKGLYWVLFGSRYKKYNL